MIDKRILIVDPVKSRLDEVSKRLKQMRAIPLTAKDGSQALRVIEVEDPDLILCDSEVAGHSSLALCDYVHEFVSSVPFVLVVDKGPGVDPEKLRLESGADAVLTRPVNPDQLVSSVQLLNRITEQKNRIKFKPCGIGTPIATSGLMDNPLLATTTDRPTSKSYP